MSIGQKIYNWAVELFSKIYRVSIESVRERDMMWLKLRGSKMNKILAVKDEKGCHVREDKTTKARG